MNMMLPPAKLNENLFADDIVSIAGPTAESSKARHDIFYWLKDFVENSVYSAFPELRCTVYMYGSVPLKTSLADSDIDVSVILHDAFNSVLQPAVCHTVHLMYAHP